MRSHIGDIGRILLSLIFLVSAVTKILDPSGTQTYMAAYGLPFTQVLWFGAVVTELLGGLALLLGARVRLVSVVLIGFLLSATLIFHTSLGDQQQLLHFMKNLAIIGGLLMVVQHGEGTTSPATSPETETPSRGVPFAQHAE